MESISLTSLAAEKLAEAVEDSVVMLTVLKSLPAAR